jgi:hypothetical protein
VPIADPYYGGPSGFDEVYAQCVEYSKAFLDALDGGRVGGVGVEEEWDEVRRGEEGGGVKALKRERKNREMAGL